MFDILTLLQCLLPEIKVTTMRQLSQIIMAMLAMSGRVTMLGISRWAGTGGSYRTVMRFFGTVIPWATVFWVFFRRHLFCPNDVYLLAGNFPEFSCFCYCLFLKMCLFCQKIYYPLHQAMSVLYLNSCKVIKVSDVAIVSTILCLRSCEHRLHSYWNGVYILRRWNSFSSLG
jgi:hypothetical protein